jgi:hypothetical protein
MLRYIKLPNRSKTSISDRFVHFEVIIKELKSGNKQRQRLLMKARVKQAHTLWVSSLLGPTSRATSCR